MRIRINWRDTLAASLIAATLLAFPLANPCQTEDAQVCTWNANTQGNGNGTTFTNFYGAHIPWSR